MNYLILFFSALSGGMGVFLFKNDNQRNLKLVLSFSGSYLFAITVLHLIPEVYSSGDHLIGVFILAGFAFQILLEQFSEGIEHGHIHKHGHTHYSFPLGIMISLCIHAFLEGMPLAEARNNPLLFGIALHHIPAAFALGSILLQNQINKNMIITLLVVFALMSPMGLVTSNAIEHLSGYFDYMMAIVIGIFLHISTTILFEASVDHRFTIYKTIAIAIGSGIALVNYFFG